jgi:5-methylcytosine-specific restriction endonuclease McrA
VDRTVVTKPFPHLYNTQRWRRRSRLQLQAHPMCAHCEAKGVTTIAALAHHVVAHDGDVRLFFFGELASLCHDCHLAEHGRAQKRIFEIGDDGWPIDARHEVYRTSTARREAQR